ncbi:MAG: PQQ-dependent sugar dehydrogenase [Aureliella sp.]
MLLLEVGGQVFTFQDQPDVREPQLAIDLSKLVSNFHRAFAIAPHPDFDRNGEIFVCYAQNPTTRPDGTRLSRFKMSLTPEPKIDPATEEVLLTWASGGHNGCAIRFDSSGYLYFSAGDGAKPYPPDEYDVGQDLGDLRSTICRIDINRRDEGLRYGIPADNPFIGVAGARPEIWAFGFRNPWRFSIDQATQQLLCGDVGWELWELVHLVEKGGNHGWSIQEGPQTVRADLIQGPGKIIPPVVAYPHSEGLSITGGYTYRGSELPELVGSYLYGDYVTGLVWGLQLSDGKAASNELLADTGLRIITFTQRRDGEILIVSFDGTIHRLVKNENAGLPSDFPTRLSETGLFTDTESLTAAPGVYGYDILTTADHGETRSEFVVGVPGRETIQVNRQQRQWKYPAGTVFAKTVYAGDRRPGPALGRRIETQVLHFDGVSWQPYSYVWNEEQSDASLVGKAGLNVELEQGRNYRIHSRSECRACHSNQAGGAIGFDMSNIELANDFSTLVDLQLLSRMPLEQWAVRSRSDPHDPSAPLDDRARSYLAANCSHCHCPGGGGTVALDLRFGKPTAEISAVNFPATQGTFDLQDPKVIVPSDPSRSTLMYRVASCGTGHMPKLTSHDNSEEGVQLIRRWIAEMPGDKVEPTQFSETSTKLMQSLLIGEMESALDRKKAAVASLEGAGELTRGLFERFLPPSERTQRLGSGVDRTVVLAAAGDASQGERWYWNSQASQCRNCHRIGGRGASIGPDLDGIGAKRTKADLLESLLDPSGRIEQEFQSTALLTVEGDAIVGLKVKQDAKSMTLRSADGKEHIVLLAEVDSQKTLPTSLMPSGLVADMTLEELANLLAYLKSLSSK